MINITQEDYSVLKQPIMERYIKLNLLDFNFNVTDELSGSLIFLNTDIDANSDIRRTCNVSFVVRDSSFDIQAGGKIWLDKYIQPYVGTYDMKLGEIIWRNQGIYLINQPSRTYDAATNTLSIQGVDLSAKLTGLRNGQLEGIPHVISSGSNVKQAIIAVLGLAGFTKYEISECYNRDGTIQEVPYDLEISAGGTVWDILVALRDILPQYQMYFDVDGVFHYELIPTGENEQTVLDDDLLNYLLLSEQISTDFESVKNYIEVYGTTHSVEHYSVQSTVVGSVITMEIPSLATAPETGDMIGWSFASETSISNASININSFGQNSLVNHAGDSISYIFEPDEYYVAIYQDDDTWLFMGHLQSKAIAYDDNPESPFNIDGSTGVIRYVCSGGDYENIQTDELALERAKVEVYWRSRLNDNINLSLVPIPWLDVNALILYDGKQWMIDKISSDYSPTGAMNITAHCFYPFYPPY